MPMTLASLLGITSSTTASFSASASSTSLQSFLLSSCLCHSSVCFFPQCFLVCLPRCPVFQLSSFSCRFRLQDFYRFLLKWLSVSYWLGSREEKPLKRTAVCGSNLLKAFYDIDHSSLWVAVSLSPALLSNALIKCSSLWGSTSLGNATDKVTAR